MPKKNSHRPVSSHARQRAFERYGIRLTDRQCKSIYEAIQKGNNLVRLGCDDGDQRIACFFENRWFLVGCTPFGSVKTFLPLESLTGEEKQRLRGDPLYRKTGVDSFHLLDRKDLIDFFDSTDISLSSDPVGSGPIELSRRKKPNFKRTVRRKDKPIPRLDRDPKKADDFFDNNFLDDDFDLFETE